MKLGELIAGLKSSPELSARQRDRDVAGIAYDSRQVTPGSLFVAVRGFHSDGHRFIPQAVERGAAAVVAEAGDAAASALPQIIVQDSRVALAHLAAAYYRHPSRQLALIGITGTKGKTTTSYLIRSILETAGCPSGLIGTIDYRVGNKVYPAPNTTPESVDVQRLLREMVDSGLGHCVMEVSSHALALGRVAQCMFAAAVFTNLAEDHLDFHRDRESYLQAKRLLFTGLAPDRTAVINNDDPAAAAMTSGIPAKVLTYGLNASASVHPAGVVGHGLQGLAFTVRTPVGDIAVRSPLVGHYNVPNILAAVGAAVSLDIDREAIARGISSMMAVPGRMEKVDEGQCFGVVVDYAHTEGSLIALLSAVRGLAKARVITLFGCGGDRDRTKRPKMGAAALAGSDVVIVTSDNPRTEDPAAIISEIESGMTAASKASSAAVLTKGAAGRKQYLVIADRHAAIETAIALAEPGDVVVLAGKGHEDYQIIGTTKTHFDDREVAREEIRRRKTACRAGCSQ